MDRGSAAEVLLPAWHRAATEGVKIACSRGDGRTGTALDCLAVLNGVPAGEAVDYLRAGYHRQAEETPWQRHYLTRFATP